MDSIVVRVVDWLLWGVIAFSVVYPLLFALASLLPGRKKTRMAGEGTKNRFLVLFPAYKEDAVIVHAVETFLQQDYPKDTYRVAVISDHMQPSTNAALKALPLTLLTPVFQKSTKGQALKYAISTMADESFDRVVVLDADNVVDGSFLTQLNDVCLAGYKAIQCHRTAKNSDNSIAVLDGASEEINNSIFRKGHNRLGLSSALIGSGMCFDYEWFSSHVNKLESAVEDRELEAFLAKEGVSVHYAETIDVMDEKVSNSDNFQRQRLRWMTGQVQTLLLMMPFMPKAMVTGNLNYIDKTLQQALIPRSILLLLLPLMALLVTLLEPSRCLKWWLLFAALCIALFAALPPSMRTRDMLGKVLQLPGLVWRMLKNLFRIDTRSKEFLHTEHGAKDKA